LGTAPTIQSPVTAKLTFERPAVTTAPAAIAYVAPAPVAQPVTPQPVATATTPVVANSAKTETPSIAPSSGKGAAILSAAYAQLGIMQDCTALVSNALSAVGIHFHGWPAGYLSLGQVVPASEAQPGDLIYYADGGAGVAHVAVYAGNGQAVHGGYNGNQTVVFSANVGSGPVFIRV
jgi:cell wall-associated NlpC family hydrolase